MQTTLPVTVDKSHIITIGEKLYTESVELIRELVNNAYDADATLVEVIVLDDYIQVKDNGTGMNLEGLKQYFNIGSQEKVLQPKSPKFKRDRIGQFGIGKFASLSACDKFVLYTQRGDFAARVVFDKTTWEQTGDKWELPMEILAPDPARGDGTTVTLMELRKKFDLEDVKRVILEGTPLRAHDFAVKLNGQFIHPKTYTGHKFPFMEGTSFGTVSGEIIILPVSHASPRDTGIEVKVKQVTVKREFFGMESWGKSMERVRGVVYADFLPITSDRSGFIIDSPEYLAFSAVMQKIMAEVKSLLGKLTSRGEKSRVSRALREALEKIEKALFKNPDLSPFGILPDSNSASRQNESKVNQQNKTKTQKEGKNIKKKNITRVKRITPDAIVKRLRFKERVVSCCLDHFGEDGPECFTEGSIIYINIDHPLYRREARNREAHILNLARLITQELCLMKDPPGNPHKAFERQSKLLRDAFAEEE